MNWFITALLAGILFSASRVMSKYILRIKGNAFIYTALHDLIAGLVLLPFLFFDFGLPTKPITWLYFFLTVIFALFGDFLTFKAFKSIDISIYQILTQARHVLVLIGGVLLFNENITYLKLVAIALIITGATIALLKKTSITWSKGIFYTILSTIFVSFAFLAAKNTLNDFSQTTCASFELILIGLLALAYLKFDKNLIINEFKLNSFRLIIASALFGFFELFLFIALKKGEVSKVIPVVQCSLVFSVLAGILLLKETERIPQKIVGTLLIIGGILIMNLL